MEEKSKSIIAVLLEHNKKAINYALVAIDNIIVGEGRGADEAMVEGLRMYLKQMEGQIDHMLKTGKKQSSTKIESWASLASASGNDRGIW
jgi:hypothetical protein